MKSSTLFLLIFLVVTSDAISEPWSFDQIVTYARKNGPEMKIAATRIDASRAMLGQAEAAYWPHLQFQSGYSQTNSPLHSFGNILNQKSFSPSIDFNDVETTDNFSSRAIASISIYSGGRDSARDRSASAELEAAKFNHAVVEKDFTMQAALSYLQYLRTNEVVRLMESSLKAFEANERAALGRNAAGTALKTELLDIQVQLESTREELVRAKNAKNLVRQSIKNLLAIEEDNFEIQEAAVKLDEPAILSLLDDRMELQTIKAKQKSAMARLEEATSGYLPRVSVQGGYEYNKGWETDGAASNYTVGLVGEWDIWDGWLTENKRKEAKANIEALDAQAIRLRENLDFELQQAKTKLSESKDALAITLKAEKLAKESAELSRMRYLEGLASSTQLIDAEHALTAASVRRAQANTERLMAILMLRRALDLGPIDFTGSN